MCLSYLMTEDEIKKHQRLIDRGWGWKNFKFYNGELRGDCQGGKVCLTNKWLNEKDYREDLYIKTIQCEETKGVEYPAGFHVFLYEDDATDWQIPLNLEIIHKVKFQDIKAVGWQTTWRVSKKSLPCIVVSQILITKDKV